jgi:hypothetical protein
LSTPVASDLQPHAAADLGRLAARGAVVDRSKRQQSARLRPVLRPFRRRAQRATVKVTPKPNRRRHRELLLSAMVESQVRRIVNPRMSRRQGALV